MRIVFANAVERILSMPSASGRIPDSTVLAMRLFEATALPWTGADKTYRSEIAWSEKLEGERATLARWTAVLGALQRAEMLDRSNVPVEDYEPAGDASEVEEESEGGSA